MELSGYLSIIRRWWWTLLVATWVAGLSGYLVGSQITPTYQATAQLLVGPINTDVNTLKASGQLAQTYAKLAISEPLLDSAIKELGLTTTAAVLAQNVRATADDVTRYLTIIVQDSDPVRAAKIANAVSAAIVQLTTSGTSRPEGELQVVDSADAPLKPIAPQVSLIVLLAAIAGLLGAVVIVLLVEYLGESVRTPEELVRLAKAPIIGSIEGVKAAAAVGQPLVVGAPQSRAAIAIRQLALKLEAAVPNRPLGILVVVPASEDDGSGQLAANLAAVFAGGGRRVVLVDADWGVHAATSLLGLDGEPGLAEALTGSAAGLPIARRTGAGFGAVPRGIGEPSDATTHARLSEILHGLAASADLVIVAVEPLHRSATALAWARSADAVLLNARRDVARRHDVAYAAENLGTIRANVVGAVLELPGRGRRGGLGRRLAPGRGGGTQQPTIPGPPAGPVRRVVVEELVPAPGSMAHPVGASPGWLAPSTVQRPARMSVSDPGWPTPTTPPPGPAPAPAKPAPSRIAKPSPASPGRAGPAPAAEPEPPVQPRPVRRTPRPRS